MASCGAVVGTGTPEELPDLPRSVRAGARGSAAVRAQLARLGPGSGAFHSIQLGDETMMVNFRYFKQLDAIDAALDAT